MNARTKVAAYLPPLTWAVLLLALGGLGYLAFLAIVKSIFIPGEFASYGLVLVTVAAAVASFFSPCSFTVLPGYIAVAGPGEGVGPRRGFQKALQNGLVAAVGVVTAVAFLGILMGALGTAIGPELSIAGPNPNLASRALRITLGAFVFAMGLLYLLGLPHRIPLLGRISSWAIRAQGESGPSLRSIYAYGAGYVLVGIG
jgi:cytochrome c biogenesis protein CcdA